MRRTVAAGEHRIAEGVEHRIGRAAAHHTAGEEAHRTDQVEVRRIAEVEVDDRHTEAAGEEDNGLLEEDRASEMEGTGLVGVVRNRPVAGNHLEADIDPAEEDTGLEEALEEEDTVDRNLAVVLRN